HMLLLKMKVEEYVQEDGNNPYRKWFDGLGIQAASKVATATYRLSLGNLSSVKWIGQIGEYRIDWGPGYRIYLAKDAMELIILFGGGTKKGQQADIQRAKELFDEYKKRKKASSKGGKAHSVRQESEKEEELA
ncbi:MAG: hypothetical protein K8F91_06470, partial [Candidatus Obscuribacterales bacterium]|nr:hypothetical protein [Candidatus Obscuribacterales bacterium]